MSIKEIIKLFAPPIFVKLARSVFPKERAAPPEWQYIADGWKYERFHPEVKGWNVTDVLEAYKSKWANFVEMTEGTGPLGVAHESDLAANEDINNHNTILTFAYALTLAARGLTSLSMLDWGGGIGHYFLLAKAVLPGVAIDYHCKDVPVVAEYGARLFPGQHFYSDDSCLQRTYDFVMASTSMHYTEDWKSLFAGLTAAAQGYVFITRLPTALLAPSYVFLQRAYNYGYNTEYLGWCLNRGEFLNEGEKLGLSLIREFIIGERPTIVDAPEPCQYRGFLFRI